MSIAFLNFAEWKATVIRYTIELQSNKLKGTREDVFKLLRTKASNIYTEVCAQVGHSEQRFNFAPNTWILLTIIQFYCSIWRRYHRMC